MAKYKAKSLVKLDGREYEAGDDIECSGKDERDLWDAGVLEGKPPPRASADDLAKEKAKEKAQKKANDATRAKAKAAAAKE